MNSSENENREMIESINLIFEKNHEIFIGRLSEIKDYILKFYEKIFKTKNLLKIERIDATEHLKNLGFRKNLSSWQNSYKNLIVSSCIIDNGIEKRYDYKFYFTEEKLAIDVVEHIEKKIQDARQLSKRNQFLEAIQNIDALLEQILDKNDMYYNKRLEKVKKEIINNETFYNKISNEIDRIATAMENNLNSEDLSSALENYANIFDLAKSINRKDIKKVYIILFKKLEAQINDALHELITKIQSLIDKGLNFIKERKIAESISLFSDIPPEIRDFYIRIYSCFSSQ